MVKAMVEMTEACYNVLQDENSDVINPEFWDNSVDLFLEKKKSVAAKSMKDLSNELDNLETD